MKKTLIPTTSVSMKSSATKSSNVTSHSSPVCLDFLLESRSPVCINISEPLDSELEKKGTSKAKAKLKIKSDEEESKFKAKLQEGILNAPNMQLPEIPKKEILDYGRQLKFIYLKQNFIRELPEYWFDELPSLAWMDFRSNKLRNIPGLKKPHVQLRVLLLQDNDIHCLPFTLGLAIKIKNIGLSENPLVDPPKEVVDGGCETILSYLKNKMNCFPPMLPFWADCCKCLSIAPEERVEGSSFTGLENIEDLSLESDPQLIKDLEETVLKLARQDRSRDSFANQASGMSSCSEDSLLNEDVREAKRIARLKYTWGLWKDVVYDGPSNKQIFEDQYAMMQKELLTKIALQKESVIQRIKNQEALSKWRTETLNLQRSRSNARDYSGMNPPYGTEDDTLEATQKPIPLRALNVEEFQTELTSCYDQLNEYASNPVSLTNVNEAMQRLKDVEEIQTKLLGMRLSVKSAVPN